MLRKSLLSLCAAFMLAACMGGDGGSGMSASAPSSVTRQAAYYTWMHPQVEGAWADGYFGAGARITLLDEFRGPRFSGDLGDGRRQATHGDWVEQVAGMIAPEASLRRLDYTSEARRAVALAPDTLEIINLSFGVFDAPRGAPNLGRFPDDRLWASAVRSAAEGRAVVVKSAGNAPAGEPARALDASFSSTEHGRTRQVVDILNLDLIGAETAIFVGALERNGTRANPASLAEYSNFAGDNPTVQDQFLVVGVDSAQMGGLAGTSFAAPIVSGYAAILGSKFPDADPAQITEQLLSTARQSTIRDYDPLLHGRGEASIRAALRPSSLR